MRAGLCGVDRHDEPRRECREPDRERVGVYYVDRCPASIGPEAKKR